MPINVGEKKNENTKRKRETNGSPTVLLKCANNQGEKSRVPFSLSLSLQNYHFPHTLLLLFNR